MAAKTTYTCSSCGGSDVQVARWVDPNTGKPDEEDLFDHVVPFATTRWCADCNEEHELVVTKSDDTPVDDEREVFVALDNDEFVCADCIPDDLRARLGDSDVEVWEYFSSGWAAPCVCRSCKLVIPVYLGGDEEES